jgi:hypothetical protein
MAYIQTPTRLIRVIETYEEIIKAMDFQWMKVNENTSFFGESSGKYYKGQREITLNRNYIIEVQHSE